MPKEKTDYKMPYSLGYLSVWKGSSSLLQYCTSSYDTLLCALPINKSIHQKIQSEELVFWNGFWSCSGLPTIL